MQIVRLDHYNVAPRDLELSRRFYVDVLGLTDGYRPPFDSRGAWLYCGDMAVVHLLCADDATDGVPGRLDHIAFFAHGFGDTVRRLKSQARPFEYRPAPKAGLHQIFVTDPDGIRIEIGFSWNEPLPAELAGKREG